MSLLLMFSVSAFFIFSNANGATTIINNSSTAKPCGANEVWNPCPRYCYFDEYCAKLIYGYYKDCPPPFPGWQCTGTCVCKPGFVRENGICSTPSVACCPVPNTEFVECKVNTCPKEKCVVRSSQPCKQNGCQCKAGFVYVNGTCSTLCPQPCGENEVCNSCPAYCSFDDTCDKLLLGIIPDCTPPPDDWQCSPKCVCKPGLVRENGTCTDPSVCCSDPNAELVQCPNPCPGGTCNQPDFAPCKMACKQYGCQCKQGFVKDKEGKCILLDQCPKLCQKNEVWNACPKYCSSEETCTKLLFGIIPDCPSPPPNWQCTGICECKPGFVRKNGSCKEPSICCLDPNAEFVKCPNPCPGGTCAQPNFAPCKAACKPYGCQCKKGFVKNSDGKCVPLSECVKKCGRNEVWTSCMPFCTVDMTCRRLFDGVKIACGKPSPDWQCSAGCICPDGFVRIDGNCVDKSACCSDPETELVSCPNPCPGGTCEKPSFLPCNQTCKAWGCQCKKGFVLNYKSECIPLGKCPPSCGANANFDCGPPIDRNCTNLVLDSDVSNYEDCVERCYCDDGYARNDRNVCIPIADCKKPKCGENERYIPCRADCSGFYYYTCSLLLNGIRVNCPRPIPGKCSEFCECTYTSNGTPYVRINGKCRHPNECCTAPNTEMVQCANRCPGGTCLQPNYTRCSTQCAPYGCRCKKGFVLDSKGICIPLEQCPKTSTTT